VTVRVGVISVGVMGADHARKLNGCVVRRVEGKVESILSLAQASRAGDVLGNHMSIRRATDFLDKHGTFPDADWEALASLGPALNVTVEQLRNHIGRILASFDPDLPVQGRAAKLDGKLYREAKNLLDDFAKPDRIEGFRVFSVRELAKHRSHLREELDRFAQARRHQVEEWSAIDTPSVLDAAEAVIDAVSDSALKAVSAAGHGLIRMGEYLADKPQAAKAASPVDDSDDSPAETK